MKKKIAMLLITAMAVSMLAGCGNEGAGNGGTAGTENTEETAGTSGAAEGGTTNAENPVLKDMDVENYVTLGSYKSLAVTAPAVSVDAAQQEQMVQQLYKNSVTAEAGGILDRAVEDGDTVNISYVGKKDDVAFDGGTADGTLLTIGSGQYIDGFEEGLIGVKPGETVDLDLTFPDNYGNAELAGAAVVFTVTVNFILPTELKDEVVAAFGAPEFSNVEELNQYVYDYLNEMAQQDYDTTVENSILEAFVASCTFAEELPTELVEQYGNNMRQNMQNAGASMGVEADIYCNYYYGMDVESFVAQYAPESAKQSLAFQAVANAENLNVDDEELNTKLAEYAANGGYDSVEAMIGENPLEDYREYFMFQKVMDFLVENAVVTSE